MALIAQLGEHCTGIAEVVGSNPAQSLKIFSGLCSSSVTAALALITVITILSLLLSPRVSVPRDAECSVSRCLYNLHLGRLPRFPSALVAGLRHHISRDVCHFLTVYWLGISTFPLPLSSAEVQAFVISIRCAKCTEAQSRMYRSGGEPLPDVCRFLVNPCRFQKNVKVPISSKFFIFLSVSISHPMNFYEKKIDFG